MCIFLSVITNRRQQPKKERRSGRVEGMEVGEYPLTPSVVVTLRFVSFARLWGLGIYSLLLLSGFEINIAHTFLFFLVVAYLFNGLVYPTLQNEL